MELWLRMNTIIFIFQYSSAPRQLCSLILIDRKITFLLVIVPQLDAIDKNGISSTIYMQFFRFVSSDYLFI